MGNRSPRALAVAHGVPIVLSIAALDVYKGLVLTAVLYAIFARLVNWRLLLRRKEAGIAAQPT